MANAGGQVFNYFRQRISPIAAAGIVGNTQQESNNDPNARGGGLIQGQGGRTSRGTLEQQLAGVWGELTGPERGTLNALRGARSPQEAARIFSQRFERPGIPMLGNRERYAQEALRSYGGLGRGLAGALGAPGAVQPGSVLPGSTQAGGTERTPAQVEDLMALVDALKPSGPSTSVEGLAVPKPGSGTGPRVPQEIPQESGPSPSDLLGLIGKIGEDASSEPGPSSVVSGGVQPGTRYAAAGSEAHAGGKLGGLLPQNAILKLGRLDEGQDGQTNPGGAIIANGNGRVVDIKSDPNGFGPSYPLVEFSSGPLAGLGPIYFGHTLAAVKVGQRVTRGQVISHTGTSGVGNATVPGWFEIGLGNTIGQGNRGQGKLIAAHLR